jgi:major membrane immunogen (membrane-anchored lipoprotein)
MTLKKLLLIGLATTLTTALVACSGEDPAPQQPAVTEVDSTPGLADGAYALISVDVSENGEVSSYLRDQMKIYTQDRFMFAFYNDLTDKVDAGTGYTHLVDGVLVETPIANQDGDLKDLSFDLTITPTEAGFTQSLKGMKYGERSVNMVEQWRTLSTETTIFDGLWKLESRSSEADEWADFVEMKLIGGGHFIFFQSMMLEGEAVKHFGFGSLQVDPAGHVVETGITSSIEGLAGTVFKLNMQMIDDNHMSQSFEMDGAVVTQTYVRI